MAFFCGHLFLETRRRREEQKEVIDFAGLIHWLKVCRVYSASDDGWNPASQLIWRISHKNTGIYTSQVVQDFCHRQWQSWWSWDSPGICKQRPKTNPFDPQRQVVSRAPFFRGTGFGMLLAMAKKCPFMVISPPVIISKRTPATSHEKQIANSGVVLGDKPSIRDDSQYIDKTPCCIWRQGMTWRSWRLTA